MDSLTTSESYKARALEAIESAKDALANRHLETAVSRSYYACYYAIHSKLEEIKEVAGSHKQTAILFRKHFIKSGKMDQSYSVILRKLSDWRMDADYAPIPDINEERAKELTEKAIDFVQTLLAI